MTHRKNIVLTTSNLIRGTATDPLQFSLVSGNCSNCFPFLSDIKSDQCSTEKEHPAKLNSQNRSVSHINLNVECHRMFFFLFNPDCMDVKYTLIERRSHHLAFNVLDLIIILIILIIIRNWNIKFWVKISLI